MTEFDLFDTFKDTKNLNKDPVCCHKNTSEESNNIICIEFGEDGQYKTSDIEDYDNPPDTQPGLWCHWNYKERGEGFKSRGFIEWDGNKNANNHIEWIKYLIDNKQRG